MCALFEPVEAFFERLNFGVLLFQELVQAFDGRQGDMIEIPGGRSVSPYLLTTAIETENSILQYRINQVDKRAFRVDVIVKSPGDSSHWRERVCEQLERVLGSGVSLSVREVARLERDVSGKRSVFARLRAGVA